MIFHNLPGEKEEKEKDEMDQENERSRQESSSNCNGAWHGAYSISADTGESRGRVCW